jgi:L-ascorbate metabolism protein UlaG (beta-lactamase superfamily)
MAAREVSGWTVGFAVFAGVMLMLVGVFHALAGLAAIIDDQYFVVSRNYAFEFDTTAWGWIHLIFGVIVAFAGYRIFSGVTWARIVGITVASISAVGNFFFIPYQPVWAMLIIALDVLVIAALCAYSPAEAQGA